MKEQVVIQIGVGPKVKYLGPMSPSTASVVRTLLRGGPRLSYSVALLVFLVFSGLSVLGFKNLFELKSEMLRLDASMPTQQPFPAYKTLRTGFESAVGGGDR